MIQQVNFSMFCNAFVDMNRDSNFSYEAKKMIYEFLDENYPNYKLDVIEICCSYSESDITDVLNSYNIDIDELTIDNDEVEIIGLIVDYLSENTSLVGVTQDNKFIYADF